MSFSRRSGIAGTEGWIAPEMMLGNRSTTCAVDVFSLGCVYYFVLTNGCHPFGESFRRQANILSGDYCLDNLAENGKLTAAKSLIEKMLSSEQTQRPTTTAILKHPLFW
jgi:serine/threonine-protein kinase/endoribonuclease IRE1